MDLITLLVIPLHLNACTDLSLLCSQLLFKLFKIFLLFLNFLWDLLLDEIKFYTFYDSQLSTVDELDY